VPTQERADSAATARRDLDPRVVETLRAVRSGTTLTMVAYGGLDHVSHETCVDGLGETTVVLEELDRALGMLLDGLPETAAVMVVSDHGFDYSVCTHIHGVDAIAVVRAPGLRVTASRRPSLRDVVPSVWALLGLPPPAAER
jgi:hypothetical protein